MLEAAVIAAISLFLAGFISAVCLVVALVLIVCRNRVVIIKRVGNGNQHQQKRQH